MMGLTSHLRIFLCMEPCDMRKSYNGLAALAANLVIGGLKSGALFPEGYEEQKDQLELIGQEITELLDYVPASLIKRRTIRPKFRRKDDRTLPPLVAPAPASPLPGGVPTFGLTAELIISKYADHLPLHRQQTILQRLGLHAPRDTLNHWTLQSLELLRPVTEAIHLECLAKSYLQLDDWSGATKTTNGSPQGTSGGELGCVAYTLIENCKRHGLDLRSYLTGAMEALVKHGPCRAAELTPSAIAKARRLRKAC